MSIELKARKQDEITILEVSGRLTLGEGTSVLRSAIRELMSEGSTRILLNLAGVTHLDSAGLESWWRVTRRSTMLEEILSL